MRENKAQKEYKKGHDEAVDIFMRQKSAIQRIAESDGFREIINYLDREIEIAEVYEDRAQDDKKRIEAFIMRKTCKNLKNFLINLAS